MSEIIIDAPVTGPDAPEVEPEKAEPKSQTQPGTEAPASDEKQPDLKAEEKPQDGQEQPDKTATEEAAELLEIAGLDMSELAAEFTRDGKLSDESYKELEENGFPKAVVDAYIRGIQAEQSEAVELAEKDVQEILVVAGGADNYEKMMAWAGNQFSEEEKEAYNSAVTGGNKHIAAFAVRGLVARYEQEYGHEPQLIGGAAVRNEVGGFKNRSEMVSAMADPRYAKDPDYTKEVEEKVLRSGLMRRR